MNVKIKKTDKVVVSASDEMYDIMRRILMRESKVDRGKEHFWTIGLDASMRILYIELISIGGTYSTIAEPMQVFRVGVQKGAVRMMLVHNHPSGNTVPNLKDMDMTDRLIQGGLILDIKVIDHLIISEAGYTSFANEGIMTKLEQSVTYVPPYKLKERMKAEQEEIIRKSEREKHAREMAQQMKKEGYDVEQIAKLTGLSKEVIGKMRGK